MKTYKLTSIITTQNMPSYGEVDKKQLIEHFIEEMSSEIYGVVVKIVEVEEVNETTKNTSMV